MTDNYDHVPGWPAVATRVYMATERIGPRLVSQKRRDAMKLYDCRYRDKIGWAERDRAKCREYDAGYSKRSGSGGKRRTDRLKNRLGSAV